MSGATAVMGASGFIGNRLVEVLHLDGATVVPVVRSASRLALAGRFDLDARIADALDPRALRSAFDGCETVVVAVAGDRRTIVGSVAAVYRAAEAAGVRRVVHLSTASVHGQSPAPGTDETSPLADRQPIAYNEAKVSAERLLLSCRERGSVEVVMLRPGIVYGPRSWWIGGLADELLDGAAALVDGGHGICNAVYVDNVVHAVRLAAAASGVDREAYLVGDDETITWRDLYRPVAAALGLDVEGLPTPPASAATSPRTPLVERLRGSPVVARVPAPLRAGLMAAYRTRREQRPPSAPTPAAPSVSLEQALLHTCRYRLPSTKATEQLGYRPSVSFAEGCRRSIAWLAFAGYPVESDPSP